MVITVQSAGSNFEYSPTDIDCSVGSRNVLFVKNDVILEAQSGATLTLPSEPSTILIKGGDLHIKSNLAYPTNEANSSFGVIVLKDEAGNGGNIYLYGGDGKRSPKIINLVGSYFADGSLISVNSAGRSEEYAANTNCPIDGSGGFCDRGNELNNQLYLKGLLVTENTIGGSDAPTPFCPVGICSDWTLSTPLVKKRRDARIYDLNYLRTYNNGSGGARANGVDPTEHAALIFQYDGRSNSNPPPLFEGIEISTSNELYY